MQLLFAIATKHVMARKRQSFVSLLGIVLGVAFFLAISSLMQGSEKDFIKRLIDNSPHITIVDEFRNPRPQPVEQAYPHAAIELRNVKPLTESRGLRGYDQIITYLKSLGVRASPTLVGQGLLNFAGKDYNVVLNGMVPEQLRDITTIQDHMLEGSVDDLIANPDGIIIGAELARKLTLTKGDNLTITATTGQTRVFKVLSIFRTGIADFDERQAFVSLKRVQAILNRPNRANRILVKIPDAMQAHELAATIEQRIGYKAISWQEASEDILSTLTIRNVIMYSVVSAVLIVAAFGIYNVISTVVMEKHRDIAIMKSMGFHAKEVQRIFVIQGVLLGIAGCAMGLPLGCLLMYALMQVSFRAPGVTGEIHMPLDWGISQFLIATAFAMIASIVAALLPARKAARVQPVDILRGGT